MQQWHAAHTAPAEAAVPRAHNDQDGWRADLREHGDTLQVGDVPPADLTRVSGTVHREQPWQDLFEELSETLELAKEHLHEEQQTSQTPPTGYLPPLAPEDAQAPAESTPISSIKAATMTAASPPPHPSALQALAVSSKRALRKLMGSTIPLLCGLVLLMVALGLIPFAPVLLGEFAGSAALGAAKFDRARDDEPAPPQQTGKRKKRTPPASDAASSNAALRAREPASRTELSIAQIHRARPGQELLLPLSIGGTQSGNAGAFAVFRNFPNGSTFSKGQSLGPSLWTAPLDQLEGLRLQLPLNVPDLSLMTIEAFDAESTLLAQAATVIAVNFSASSPVAPQPVAPKNAWQTLIAQSETVAAGRALMISAHHQQAARASELTWNRVEPRQDLVHVAVDTESKPSPARAASSAVGDRLVQPSVAPAVHRDAPTSAFIGEQISPIHALSRPATTPPPDHWTPAPDIRKSEDAAASQTSSAPKDPIARQNAETESTTAAARRKRDTRAPAKREEKKSSESHASSRSERAHGSPARQGLGGPDTQHQPARAATPEPTADAKWRGRSEIMDPGKGI